MEQQSPQPQQNSTPIPQSTPAVPPVHHDGGKKWVIIVMAVAVLGLLGTIVWYLLMINTRQYTTPVQNSIKSTKAVPTSIPVPTLVPQTEEQQIQNVNLASPDADLQTVQKDIQSL